MKILTYLFTLALFLILSACTDSEEEVVAEEEPEEQEIIKVAYVDWESEIASAYVVKEVIENRLDYNCEILSVTAISMWESVAAGDQDAMFGAWLPSLQGHYFSAVEDDVVFLGPNLENVEMGLVVPVYTEINSIEELNDYKDEFGGKIIGIDPEAGLMGSTERAIEKYSLEYELISGSDKTMTSAIDIAFEEERFIVATGWNPHWKFARWDLKYLEDPENVYGEAEYIGTVVRQNLEEDMPEVYAFFDNFYWEASDMEQVMLWFTEEDMSAEEAAARWVSENEEKVDQWVAD